METIKSFFGFPTPKAKPKDDYSVVLAVILFVVVVWVFFGIIAGPSKQGAPSRCNDGDLAFNGKCRGPCKENDVSMNVIRCREACRSGFTLSKAGFCVKGQQRYKPKTYAKPTYPFLVPAAAATTTAAVTIPSPETATAFTPPEMPPPPPLAPVVMSSSAAAPTRGPVMTRIASFWDRLTWWN